MLSTSPAPFLSALLDSLVPLFFASRPPPAARPAAHATLLCSAPPRLIFQHPWLLFLAPLPCPPGLLPILKEVIEILFQEGLIKVRLFF